MRLERASRLVLAGLVLTAAAGCAPVPDVDCGPLPAADCERRVAEIREAVDDSFPGRRIEAIRIVNGEGHATVTLDDGTEVGFGERL